MVKTNRNIKRLEFRKKLIILAVIQVVMVLVFLYSFQINAPVALEDTKSITVTVDDKKYERYIFASGNTFSFTSNSVEYRFSKSSAGYSMSELYDHIKIGDSLSIIYVEGYSLLGKNNWVLDARTQTKEFRSIEAYNSSTNTQRVLGIIIFVIVELIFLAISTFVVVFYGQELKLFGFGQSK